MLFGSVVVYGFTKWARFMVGCGARRGGLIVPRCKHGVRGVISCYVAVRSERRHGHYTSAVVGVVKGVFPRLHSMGSFGRVL